MKSIFKILLFVIYLIFIFCVDKVYLLLLLVTLNFLFVSTRKMNIILMMKRVLILAPFILFTVLINIIVTDTKYAITLGVRLIVVYTTTYIFLNSISIKEICSSIEIIFQPISHFTRWDTKQIGLIIGISMSVLPIMLSEIQMKYNSIKSKTIKIKFKDIYILMKTIFISILIKQNEYENALITKGYGE